MRPEQQTIKLGDEDFAYFVPALAVRSMERANLITGDAAQELVIRMDTISNALKDGKVVAIGEDGAITVEDDNEADEGNDPEFA